MFTVHNRDVGRLVVIAVLCCILSPRTLSAKTSDIISTHKTEYFATTVAPRDSYENYLKRRRTKAIKETAPKNKSSAIKKIRYQKKICSITKTSEKNRACKRHTVRTGDTLTTIARRHATTVEALLSCNNLKNKNSIKIGMSLNIPAASTKHSSPRGQTTESQKVIKPKNSPRFQWPLNTVIRYRNDGLDGVKPIGIIITGKKGSPVLSSATGTVKKIGSMRGFGKYIVIAHEGRYSTVYANLDRVQVSSGERVTAGNAIGRINSFNQKLHFQIDFEGKPENPLKYLPGNM